MMHRFIFYKRYSAFEAIGVAAGSSWLAKDPSLTGLCWMFGIIAATTVLQSILGDDK